MVASLALCAAISIGADTQGPSSAVPPAPVQSTAARTATAQPAASQAATVPAAPQPAVQKAAPKKVELITIERNVIDHTNAERARYGLPALEVDDELMESARGHATWMTLNQTVQHTRQPLAENIAMGQRSSQEVVQCWMNSSGHRANILNAGHRRIGVAAYRTIQGTIFWCQQFRN